MTIMKLLGHFRDSQKVHIVVWHSEKTYELEFYMNLGTDGMLDEQLVDENGDTHNNLFFADVKDWVVASDGRLVIHVK